MTQESMRTVPPLSEYAEAHLEVREDPVMFGLPTDVIETLSRPFAESEVKYRETRQGGRTFKTPYATKEAVQARFDEAFGNAWSSMFIHATETPDHIVLIVRVTAMGISHDGVGAHHINRDKDKGELIYSAHAQAWRGAYTNALRKCGGLFGMPVGDPGEGQANGHVHYEDDSPVSANVTTGPAPSGAATDEMMAELLKLSGNSQVPPGLAKKCEQTVNQARDGGQRPTATVVRNLIRSARRQAGIEV